MQIFLWQPLGVQNRSLWKCSEIDAWRKEISLNHSLNSAKKHFKSFSGSLLETFLSSDRHLLQNGVSGGLLGAFSELGQEI
jgi:hypothetical protein